MINDFLYNLILLLYKKLIITPIHKINKIPINLLIKKLLIMKLLIKNLFIFKE